MVFAQSTRSVEPVETDAAQLVSGGRYYAIVIGINKYPAPLPQLKTAVNDARAVANLLEKSYGFKTTPLLDKDATRVNILNTINHFRDTLGENDSLLIYYAGHGYSDKVADKAYWLPVDADSIYSSNRIIADELTTDVRVQNARHVLIISDSCYSGGLSRDIDSPEESVGRTVFLDRMARSRSRTLMASGGDEPVSDTGTDGHSVFAYAVLRSLQQSTQSVFTASDLFYGSVRQQVAGKSDQVPQYSIIRNSSHDEGDFVFIKSDAPRPAVHGDTSKVVPAVIAKPNVVPDSFVVISAPAGAEIHVDYQITGHSTGSATRIKVDPGTHVVEVMLNGYEPWKQSVAVGSGKEANLIAALSAIPSVKHLPNSGSGSEVSKEDRDQIQQLFTRYANAVNGKDVKQLKLVWPEIPSSKLAEYRALPRGLKITLELNLATLIGGNDNAIAHCRQTSESGGAVSSQDNVTFLIGRFNSGWIINGIPPSN